MKNILILVLALCAFAAEAQNNFKVPPYETFKLKNGLTVYLMEQHEVPLINVSAVFDAVRSMMAKATASPALPPMHCFSGRRNTPRRRSRK